MWTAEPWVLLLEERVIPPANSASGNFDGYLTFQMIFGVEKYNVKAPSSTLPYIPISFFLSTPTFFSCNLPVTPYVIR